MNIPERLTAAADRLETLDKAATQGPWRVNGPHSLGGQHVRGLNCLLAERVTLIASAGDRGSQPNLDLIAALRPLAPLIAAWLRDDARIFHDWHDDAEGGCGHYRSPAPLGAFCVCFARPIAVANAILGGAS